MAKRSRYRFSLHLLSILILLAVCHTATLAQSRDCAPVWYDDSCRSYMLERIRFGLTYWDQLSSGVIRGGQLVYAKMDAPEPRDRVFIDIDEETGERTYRGKDVSPEPVDTLATDVKLTLLAWQELRLGEGPINQVLLTCATYKDSVGSPAWALVIMEARDSSSDWRVRWWGDEPLKRYDHRPTNKEVYEFLEALNCMECRMFIFDKAGTYDWNGLPVTFVKGAVCEENWKHAIGEKPSKGFPSR